MSNAVIDAHNIVKTYGKGESLFTALDRVNISIDQGEMVAIIGKSGSGKSTLMHILALLDEADSGSLEINGTSATGLKNEELNKLRNDEFGFVFQQFFLNAQQTVLENVTLPLKIAGVSKKDREAQGMAALQELEIGDKAYNKASDLSGGQKQRVVIARALINNPSVIFADEPTGNLDTATSAVVEQILFNLNQEKGITVVIVTHDDELAARCERQIRIQDGKVVTL